MKKHCVLNIFILKNYLSEIEIQLGVQYSDLLNLATLHLIHLSKLSSNILC